MLRFPRCLAAITVTLLLTVVSPPAWATCDDSGVVLQILGSGGPFGTGRASSGYLVWVDGVSRIMVDAGGGTFARFHAAGAAVGDLDLLALSHFHPDHAAEVPALLWTQRGTLRVAGPSGNAEFPSVDEFLTGLFGPVGVFRVIGARMAFEPVRVDVSAPTPQTVFRDGAVRVRAVGVPHGPVPAIGFRVDVGDASVAFSSDQTGTNPAFAELIRGVDVLVVHFAASENAVGGTLTLHATPSVWGRMAADAGVGTLVLSHLSAGRSASYSRANLEDNLDHVRSRYQGRLVVAEDLQCVPIE